jgi:hypothetical protein
MKEGSLGRPRSKRKDNIKIDLKQTADYVRVWTGFIWLRIGTMQMVVILFRTFFHYQRQHTSQGRKNGWGRQLWA